MVDFSNISVPTLAGIAIYARGGGELYDELLLEAVELIDPPLLPEEAMLALAGELDPKVSHSRGRPKQGALRSSRLLELVRSEDRPDVPQVILDTLMARLSSGRRHSYYDLMAPQTRHRRFDDRNFVIDQIYQFAFEALTIGPPYQHEILGELEFGEIDQSATRHDQALKVAQYVSRTRFGARPPGLRAIANLISRRNSQNLYE